MGIEPEEAVRAFMGVWPKRLDAAQIECPLLRLRVGGPVRWNDAFRKELLRQAFLFNDAESEIVNIASVGETVFVERVDSATMNDKAAAFHVVGVFEVDADGKIASWRDYLDSRKISVKVGPDRAGTGA